MSQVERTTPTFGEQSAAHGVDPLVSDVQRLLFERVKGYGTGRLPLELNTVAKGLGATDIRYLAREVHGLTDFTRNGVVVYLAMSRSDGRRRFTLAHEIGHLLLGHEGANALVDPFVTLPLLVDLERSCDEIASELVLPRSWLKEHAGQLKDLKTVKNTAGQMRVSPAALVVGLRRVGRPAAMVRLQRARNGSWVPVHRVGLPRSLSGDFGVSAGTGQMLASAMPGDSERLVPFEVVTTSGHCHGFEAFVGVGADSAMVFIPDTRRTARAAPMGPACVWSSGPGSNDPLRYSGVALAGHRVERG